MSDSLILGIDYGYAGIKTAHCVFPSGLVAYEHEPDNRQNVLEWQGRW